MASIGFMRGLMIWARYFFTEPAFETLEDRRSGLAEGFEAASVRIPAALR